MHPTAQLQTEWWSAVQAPAAAQLSFLVSLGVSGVNDALNSQGNTRAAWRNRIPITAWRLMFAVAICCNLLVGDGARNVTAEAVQLMGLPLAMSISLFLIADIGSPRGGVNPVNPQNLLSLAESLRVH
jgi:hypothetical protein